MTKFLGTGEEFGCDSPGLVGGASGKMEEEESVKVSVALRTQHFHGSHLRG